MTDQQNQHDRIPLEGIRNISLPTLMALDMERLTDLQRRAEELFNSARLTKDWIDQAINFKLYEESKKDKSGN